MNAHIAVRKAMVINAIMSEVGFWFGLMFTTEKKARIPIHPSKSKLTACTIIS